MNEHSRKLGRAATSEELYRNERMKKTHAMQRAAAEQVFEEECTFHPELNPTGQRFNPERLAKYRINPEDTEGISARIEEQRREKEERIEEQKRLQDYEELRECTFQPNVAISKRTVQEPDGPVIVRGLGRHLELKEMAKKKEHDRLQREEEVFKTQPRAANPGGYTVPQPFNLSENAKGKERAERARKQVMADEMKECTFQPKTNLMSNRDLIRQIMGEDDL